MPYRLLILIFGGTCAALSACAIPLSTMRPVHCFDPAASDLRTNSK